MVRPGVYILQSIKTRRYYIGSTNNILRRIQEYNRGAVKATRFLTPMELKVFIERTTIAEARQAEYALKQYKNRAIIEKVVASAILPWEYKDQLHTGP